MKVVVAPDKFRGSLSAAAAAEAITVGVLRVDPAAEVIQIPMADGGEGTVEALVAATEGHYEVTTVAGPRGKPVEARFGLVADGRTAVLEMASASGLALLSRDERDPWTTTTRGTGELLLAAIEAGAERIVLGIGGSATNDGGAGFAQALGYRLIDASDRDLPGGGGFLDRLARIDSSSVDPRLRDVAISVACDVDNPLCGPRGASAIFGPQKGADPEMVAKLDRNLAHLARVIARDLGCDILDKPGSGAGGGLGAGAVAFAGATLEPGVALVARVVGLEDVVHGADLVLTGEGAIDRSSVGGKTAVGVAAMARALGVPVIALAGAIGSGAEGVIERGVDAYLSLCNRPMTLDSAVAGAADLLACVSEQATRIFLLGRRSRSTV